MSKKRYLPGRSFPSYIFVPGENPHPKKSGGHMEGEKDPVSPPLDPHSPGESDFFRYSLDLFNHGYYWEAHVYLESLWNAHERKGPVSDFLKALIKLSAAGVKINLKQNQSAREHLDRALELFREVEALVGNPYLGFDINFLCSEIRKIPSENPALFELHPSWE